MTIADMRERVGLPSDATDFEVVMKFAAMLDDGIAADVVEPVSPAMLRAQCRIDDGLEDQLIQQKIRAAREWVEGHTSRILAQRTLAAHFRNWSAGITLESQPVTSIDAIAYDGAAGGAIYTGAIYRPGTYPLTVRPAEPSWPRLAAGGGVTVIYSGGYGAGEVPPTAVEAILVLAAGMMSQREGGYEASLGSAKSLLRSLRNRRL
ncbi:MULTISPECIES: head-tail connector protein [unclassified Sphingobium]|uniref:head-tail connector protein n=1 Tax=unclassified Sphingobium TaxID=2611147 RepID=UPI002224C0EF|nr:MULTISPECIES: hypothetical protein [unclassified Sphingobium]MCW2395885.1 putative phiE125 gp8 family phage protein [Sphingobium sp. B8D3B]MCW2419401.1 putative phiE125 gp8 family phage protein [Sphingobium sp. B8D3C]